MYYPLTLQPWGEERRTEKRKEKPEPIRQRKKMKQLDPMIAKTQMRKRVHKKRAMFPRKNTTNRMRERAHKKRARLPGRKATKRM